MSLDIDDALQKNKLKANKKIKASDNKKADEFLNEIKQFESDRINLAIQSKKVAWKIAIGASIMSLLLTVAIIIIMPLKTVDYRLVRVNDQTGRTEIVQPLADAKGITYGEALDKYWLNYYVNEYGSYQWQTVQDSFDFINISSTGDVFGAYSHYIRAKNSPVEIFADNKKIILSDVSISFLPTSQDQMLAQVFFTKNVINNDDTADPVYEPTKWAATITFDYKKEIDTAKQRLLNPLGFRVTSYKENRVMQ